MDEGNLRASVRGLLLSRITRVNFGAHPEYCTAPVVDDLLKTMEYILASIIEDYRESLGKEIVDIDALMKEVGQEIQSMMDSVVKTEKIH